MIATQPSKPVVRPRGKPPRPWWDYEEELARQKQQARRHYLRAIKLDPELRDTHLNLAVLLEAEGDLEEAKVHLDYVSRMDPNNAQVKHGCVLTRADTKCT